MLKDTQIKLNLTMCSIDMQVLSITLFKINLQRVFEHQCLDLYNVSVILKRRNMAKLNTSSKKNIHLNTHLRMLKIKTRQQKSVKDTRGTNISLKL